MPRGVRVDLTAGLQTGVGHPKVGLGHAEADVADLDDQAAVAGVHRRHPHLRGRRRVAQRVVEQLGEQVHQVAGHGAGDLAVGHGRGDDAGVVLDLGGGGVDDGRDRHRFGLLARHPRAREHQQVGAVAAHPGGEVVQAEQALQPIGVLLVAFEAVDQRQLLIDQRPAAPRQRLEHVADLELQPGLLTGQQHGLLVQLVDGVGDLADLLGGVHGDRLDRPGSPPARTRSISRARSSWATLSALSRSLRSGRTSERATSVTISSASRIAAPTIAESRMASVRCVGGLPVDRRA